MIPTSTNISVEVSTKLTNADAIAVFLHKQAERKHPELTRLPDDLREVAELRSADLFSGKSNELAVQLIEGKPARRLLVVGLGNIDEFSCECLREAAAVVAIAARKQKLKRVAMILPPVPEKLPGFPKSQPKSPGLDLACEAMAAGLMLASFDWAEYRGKVTKKQHENPAIEFTIVVPDTDRAAAKDAVNRAVVISQGQNRRTSPLDRAMTSTRRRWRRLRKRWRRKLAWPAECSTKRK